MNDTSGTGPPKLVVPYLTMRTKEQIIDSELAYEIAAILIEWGTFENALFLDLEQLRSYAVVKKLAEQVPFSFEKKITLWKKSVFALFPTVGLYKGTASEICTKGKMVAKLRNQMIHGLWRPADEHPGGFYVLSGLDRHNKADFFLVTSAKAKILHQDIKTLANAMWSFNVTRMFHASQGLLTAHPVSSDDHPADPTLPNGEKS